MPRLAEILAAIAGAILALIVAMALLAYGVQGRSIRALGLETYLWATDYARQGFTTPEGFKDYLAANQDESQDLPLFNEQIGPINRIVEVAGMTVHRWYTEHEDGPVLVYFHGGGFTNRPTLTQFLAIDAIAEELGAQAVMPYYPLAPAHHAQEAYTALTTFYAKLRSWVDGQRPIVFIGDSAGATIALSLTQQLRDAGKELPDALVLLSPWLDARLSHPDIAELQDKDPILYQPALAVKAQAWAGALPLDDPRISPALGTVHGLPPITLVTGTRELFYPDIEAFHQRLEREGIGHHYLVGQAMNHAYPVLPIPEAREAGEQILTWITEDLDQ